MNAKADQAQCRSYTRTAHHDMTRIQVYLCHRLVVAIGQLHQGAACAVLGLFRPRFVDEHIQYVDDGRVCREGCASRWEQRDLLHALSKVALHRCLDRLICVFARVLRIQQQTVDQEGNEASSAEKHLLGRVADAEGQ
jgi:hypothetical protein